MKRQPVTLGLVLCVLLLPVESCRKFILEDRSDCPRFLFFDIGNDELFETSDRVFATAYRMPEDELVATERTFVGDIEEERFCFELKKAEAWNGYGLLGITRSHLVNGSEWIVDEGDEADPLFRFEYAVPGFEERRTVPVEMVKDHANVTVKFVRFDRFEGAGGQFPFTIVIRGNTCGIDGRTGLPVRGPFRCTPEETFGGTFRFILPRQADHALTMELWAKPGLFHREGLVDAFSLSALFQQLGSVNWEARNLPDIYLEVDYVESAYRIEVMDWEDTRELHYGM